MGLMCQRDSWDPLFDFRPYKAPEHVGGGGTNKHAHMSVDMCAAPPGMSQSTHDACFALL